MTKPKKLSRNTPVGADGVWSEVFESNTGRAPALFLDRDGVIIEDTGYLHRPEDIRFIPEAANVIAEANRRAVPVVIVTNQGGIGLGLFGWDDFALVQEAILDQLAEAGARVSAVFACPHHPRGQGSYGDADHPARKPNPGMLLAADQLLGLDLAQSWIIGDHSRDIEAGKNAGIEGGLHVLSGHGNHPGQREAALALADGGFHVKTSNSIYDAFKTIPLVS